MIDFRAQAIDRMERRKSTTVRWTFADRIVEYKRIRSCCARNWDGSPAGGGDSDRTILQCMTWVDGGTPRFTNWW